MALAAATMLCSSVPTVTGEAGVEMSRIHMPVPGGDDVRIAAGRKDPRDHAREEHVSQPNGSLWSGDVEDIQPGADHDIGEVALDKDVFNGSSDVAQALDVLCVDGFGGSGLESPDGRRAEAFRG